LSDHTDKAAAAKEIKCIKEFDIKWIDAKLHLFKANEVISEIKFNSIQFI
jgi:hypothetical protein